MKATADSADPHCGPKGPADGPLPPTRHSLLRS